MRETPATPAMTPPTMAPAMPAPEDGLDVSVTEKTCDCPTGASLESMARIYHPSPDIFAGIVTTIGMPLAEALTPCAIVALLELRTMSNVKGPVGSAASRVTEMALFPVVRLLGAVIVKACVANGATRERKAKNVANNELTCILSEERGCQQRRQGREDEKEKERT